MTDYHQPPDNKDDLFAELGLGPASSDNNFNPSAHPDHIGEEVGVGKKNKYAVDEESQENPSRKQEQKEGKNEIDIDIPDSINTVSTIDRESIKNKKKPAKTLRRGNRSKKAPAKQAEIKPESVQIGMDEVAEWAEKGTKAQNDEEDSFDEEGPEDKENTVEQQKIRKRLQEKIKNYENPPAKPSKNTLSSLKDKANELKMKKQTSPNSLEDSSNQLVVGKKQPGIVEQEEEEQDGNQSQPEENRKKESHQKDHQQQEEDPWEKINQKTLAQKQQNQAQSALEGEQLIQYYKTSKLPDNSMEEEEEDEEPETGFFQQLCSCLNPKKKKRGRTDMEKQILKISELQLTNTPEQMQLLRQIWNKLTLKKFQRYGEHWNQIGFQGRDPATDLRSAGVLSLVHWYAFILAHEEFETKVYNSCIEFDIPLALTHIKISGLVVRSIRKNLLAGDSWQDFQNWYNAFTIETFNYILNNAKDLEQIGELVEKSVERTGKDMPGALKKYHSQQKGKK